MDEAETEIFAFTRGDETYMGWLADNLPLWAIQEAVIERQIQATAADAKAPLACFETHVGMFVAIHKHLFRLWQNREAYPPGAMPSASPFPVN